MYSANYPKPGRGTQFKVSGPPPETISLRDEIAMRLLPALYSTAAADERTFQHDDWPVGLALDAYRIADAMLAAREGGE